MDAKQQLSTWASVVAENCLQKNNRKQSSQLPYSDAVNWTPVAWWRNDWVSNLWPTGCGFDSDQVTTKGTLHQRCSWSRFRWT